MNGPGQAIGAVFLVRSHAISPAPSAIAANILNLRDLCHCVILLADIGVLENQRRASYRQDRHEDIAIGPLEQIDIVNPAKRYRQQCVELESEIRISRRGSHRDTERRPQRDEREVGAKRDTEAEGTSHAVAGVGNGQPYRVDR